MADLRLVGVHDDGEHLLLSGADGEIFLLPIDEALRVATSKTPRSPLQGSSSTATKLSPREIQSRIRAGASAAQVAEDSGLELAQVQRYEGPVLAEREHIAEMARKVEVSAGGASTEGTRSVFGENAVTLEEMVTHRLGTFGINPSSLEWDAWRVNDGSWIVTANFDTEQQQSELRIGEDSPARWTFHSARKAIFNANRWAQQLSELEPVDSLVPDRRLSAVADRPFDFETDTSELAEDNADESSTDLTQSLAQEETSAEDDDPASGEHGLLDMLRSRRGQRLGFDEDGDDELATMLGSSYQGSHPLGEFMRDPDEDDAEFASSFDSEPNEDDAEEPEQTQPDPSAKTRLKSIPFLSLAPTLHDDQPIGIGEVSTATREITVSGDPKSLVKSLYSVPPANASADADTSDNADTEDDSVTDSRESSPRAALPTVSPTETSEDASDIEVAARLERKSTSKAKRSSVPSWDEIVFGTKGD